MVVLEKEKSEDGMFHLVLYVDVMHIYFKCVFRKKKRE